MINKPVNCPNCQATNRDAARFCRRCGQWLEPGCPNCGNALPDLPVFCDRCGYQVSRIPAPGNPGLPPAAGAWPKSPAAAQPPASSGPPAAQEPPPAEDGSVPASPLQKYIPQELLVKLEAARASGSMAGERRVVTMLFCDVKGSTVAAEKLDPEDWTEVINGAFEHMIRPVYKYEGTVARLMGDGLLAFFGAPIAHEDDPQRAVLAGLEILDGLDEYRAAVADRFDIDLNVRVGINTGPVVVGAVGSDMRMEYTAMGDAINLASRMEQTARPGTVQVAHDTYRLVSPMFEVEPLGEIEVKGRDTAIPAYRVVGRKAEAGRLRGISGVEVPLIGRSSELGALLEGRERVNKGVGWIVSLIGEAGLGKSRLIRELKSATPAAVEISWLETSSQSYETSQPYNLFRRLIWRMAGAALNDPPGVLREKLKDLAQTDAAGPDGQSFRVFESLFGLASEAGEPPLEGETFKQLFLATTRDLWQAWATRQPTVLVCDDLHWADGASAELLSGLFELTERVPLLIICAMRPERASPGWVLKHKADADYPHRYTELPLKPLSDQESDELITRLALGAEIPGQLRRRILEKAAGIPYYLEEVIRSLLESRALVRENGAFRWNAPKDFKDFDLPDSLQALLVSRIDRLEEDARRTLQLASVVGRSFYYRVLARVGEPTRLLDHQLARLVRGNMIREAAREPELEYIFSNVLTQEAAYQTILFRQRRLFHQRVGEALEALFPERREELAPVLAVHFSEAGDHGRALEYHTLAGDFAYRMYALDEAVDHYKQALDFALEEEEAGGGSEQLIHLYTRLGRSYEHQYRFDQVRDTYEAMRAQAEERDDPAMRLAYSLVLGTVTVTHTPLHDSEEGQRLAEGALALARELGDRRAEARAHWNLTLLHRIFSGNLEAAVHHGELSLQISRELAWEEQLAYTLNDLSFAYMGLADLPKGLQVLEEARGLWRKFGNLPMLADNLNVSGIFLNYAGEFERSQELLEEGIQVARSIGNIWNEVPLRANLADSYFEQGIFGAAIESVRISLEGIDDLEYTGGNLLYLSKLARYYAELGLVEEGFRACEQLLTVDTSRWSDRTAETIYAMQARLHLADDNLEEARKLIDQAHPNVETVTVFPFFDHYLGLTSCEVLLALSEFPRLLKLTGEYIPHYEASGVGWALADLYTYQGLALRATGRDEAAGDSLTRARQIADETGSRRILWKTLAALAEFEAQAGDAGKAKAFWHQSAEVIRYIADHAGGEENRESFLARRDVREALEKSGSMQS